MIPLYRLLIALAIFGCVCIPGAKAQMTVSAPTLSVMDLQVYCDGLQPYVSFTMPVHPSDNGRPGLVFVGMHDGAGSRALFLSGEGWHDWQGGMFPVYEVASGGVGARSFTLPLNTLLAGGGWRVYVGYGSLSVNDEALVLKGIAADNRARAARGGAGMLDANHYRRSLIQADLVRYGKYAYVDTGIENNSKFCEPKN